MFIQYCHTFIAPTHEEQEQIPTMAIHLRSLGNYEDDEDINVLAIRFKAQRDKNPSKVDLMQLVLRHKECACLIDIPLGALFNYVFRMLSWRIMIWECEFILIMHRYFTEYNTMPSHDQFIEYCILLENNITTHENASQEHADASQEHETNPHDISKFITQSDNTMHECGLCFETITCSEYYKLPCSHKFHSLPDAGCVEGTIKKWFEKNKTCPICRLKLE